MENYTVSKGCIIHSGHHVKRVALAARYKPNRDDEGIIRIRRRQIYEVTFHDLQDGDGGKEISTTLKYRWCGSYLKRLSPEIELESEGRPTSDKSSMSTGAGCAEGPCAPPKLKFQIPRTRSWTSGVWTLTKKMTRRTILMSVVAGTCLENAMMKLVMWWDFTYCKKAIKSHLLFLFSLNSVCSML
jgi:hypothetical protein